MGCSAAATHDVGVAIFEDGKRSMVEHAFQKMLCRDLRYLLGVVLRPAMEMIFSSSEPNPEL